MSSLVQIHTKDRQTAYLDRHFLDKAPGLKTILEDIRVVDDLTDIIIAGVTSKAIDHILNIIKHGATAVFKDDMKDVIEAGKLFLNVDLGTGIIKTNEEGFVFQIEKRFDCRKYVGSSIKDEEIICISLTNCDKEVHVEESKEVLLNKESHNYLDPPKYHLNNVRVEATINTPFEECHSLKPPEKKIEKNKLHNIIVDNKEDLIGKKKETSLSCPKDYFTNDNCDILQSDTEALNRKTEELKELEETMDDSIERVIQWKYLLKNIKLKRIH